MKPLHGQILVNELRKLADSVKKRLWIVVPYMGSPETIKKILGRTWLDNNLVSVRLLTDISDTSCIDSETIRDFHNRGEVKTLTGLHAKIYIVDDACLITSANLTNKAFSKRYEIGVLCNDLEAVQIIKTFDNWWKIAENIKPDKINKIISKKNTSNEERTGVSLPLLCRLPNSPDSLLNSNDANTNLGGGYYIVNTDRRWSDVYYKEMLNEEKASAYGKASHSIRRIEKGNVIFLYHKNVGIVAYGYTTHPAKTNDENEEDEEVYTKMKFEWKVDPDDEPEKAVKVSEINEKLGTGHSFPQTVFSIPEKMALIIQKLALKKAPENMI